MDNKEIKKSNLKVRIYIVIFISILLLLLTSYGYFYVTRNQSDRNRLTGACFNTTFTDGDSISITNAVPMDNTEGLKTNPYHFTLNNTCSTKVKYYVILNVKDNSFEPKNLNISIGGGYGQKLSIFPINTLENTIDSGYTTSYLIKTATLEQGSTTENIRLWVNEEANMDDIESGSSKTFTAKIKIVSEVASEYNLATTKIMKLAEGASSSSTDVITKPAPEGATCTNTLAYDGTVDNNLRYVGANPCNYVKFNDENITNGSAYYMANTNNVSSIISNDYIGPFNTEEECNAWKSLYSESYQEHCSCVTKERNFLSGWRIIGVMNNIDDGTGKTETRLKLVRVAELGVYSYDDKYNPSVSGQKYKGINDWSYSEIMKSLNSDYLDSTSNDETRWHSNSSVAPYDYRKGIKPSSLKLIGDSKWYLGGTDTVNTAQTVYTTERGTIEWGTSEGQSCIDDYCPRTTSWVGKVGLIYMSDYSFAAGGPNRNACINDTTLNLYYNTNNCTENDWINDTTKVTSLVSISPDPRNVSEGSRLYFINYAGRTGSATGNSYFEINPVVYLNSSVTITGGTGSPDDPYTLG